MKQIDLVVAVRDEEETIPLFVEEVRALGLPDDTRLRIVFVEDSSTDDTRDVLRRLARESRDVTYYSVQNAFGQGPAIVFGLSRCTGDAAITMDVDGTHPVAAIPELVKRFIQGDEIVQCVRRAPQDRERYRNVGAAAFHQLARLLTGVDTRQQNFYYRLMSARAVRDLLKEPRYWRYLRLPLHNMPRVSFVLVDAIDRRAGQSKYHFFRLAALAVDGVLSLLSRRRLVLASALVGAAVSLLWLPGLRVLPMACLLAYGSVVARYVFLRRFNLLDRMTVIESADVATMNAPALAAGRA